MRHPCLRVVRRQHLMHPFKRVGRPIARRGDPRIYGLLTPPTRALSRFPMLQLRDSELPPVPIRGAGTRLRERGSMYDAVLMIMGVGMFVAFLFYAGLCEKM